MDHIYDLVYYDIMSLQFASDKTERLKNKIKSHGREYVLITIFVYVFYLVIETPWMLYSVDITFDQYFTWVWQGAIFDLILPYPLAKILQRYANWLKIDLSS